MALFQRKQKPRRFDLAFDFSESNRKHDIAALLTASEPQTKIWGTRTVLDQKAEGACAAFSGIGLLQCAPYEKAMGYGYDECIKDIYWPAQKIDIYPGGAYPGAKKRMDGTSLNAIAKVLKDKGLISSYRWSFTREDFRNAVINHGPAHIGVRIYEGMMSTRIGGWISPTGACLGGHALYVAGYVAGKTPYYISQNSWGRRWGGWMFKNAGRCRITEDDLFRLLFDERGQACFYSA
jgi:hypothetical protein